VCDLNHVLTVTGITAFNATQASSSEAQEETGAEGDQQDEHHAAKGVFRDHPPQLALRNMPGATGSMSLTFGWAISHRGHQDSIIAD